MSSKDLGDRNSKFSGNVNHASGKSASQSKSMNVHENLIDMANFELTNEQFEELEQIFHEIVKMLSEDKHLEKFRVEYEKLHRSLLNSHENEKRLMKKCIQLNNEILSNARKVRLVLSLSEGDQRRILLLKKEIERVWQMVESSQSKEKKARTEIDSLRLEISELNRLIDEGMGESRSHEITRAEMLEYIKLLQKDNQNRNKVNSDNDARIKKLESNRESLVKQNQKKLKSIKDMQRKYKDFKKEVVGKKLELQKMRNELEEFRAEKENKEIRIQNLVDKRELVLDEKKLVDEKLKKQLNIIHLNRKKNEVIQEKADELNKELKHYYQSNTELEKSKLETFNDIDIVKNECQRLQAEYEKQLTEIDSHMVENRKLKSQNEDLLVQKNRLYEVKKSKEKELENLKIKWHKDQSKIEDLQHSKNILVKRLGINEGEMKHQKKEKLKIDVSNFNDEKKISNLQYQSSKLLEKSYMYEKEREKYKKVALDCARKYFQAVEEIEIQNNLSYELKLRLNEGIEKIRQQDALYEVMSNDKNVYAKKINETRGEINRMKSEFNLMTKQRKQLTEEIEYNHKRIKKIKLENNDVQEILKQLERKLSSNRDNERIEKERFEKAQQRVDLLNTIIKTGEREYNEQLKDHKEIQNDRDILSNHLIKRNNEIKLLNEKIEIQKSLIRKGERDYARVFKELQSLNGEFDLLSKNLAEFGSDLQTTELRCELFRLDKILLRERQKYRTLVDELTFPINVHRWRKLKGVNPESHENIEKIRTLQKRLIQKTENLNKKRKQQQEWKERIMVVKQSLSRKHGKEMEEQLLQLKGSSMRKKEQIVVMNAELVRMIGNNKMLKRKVSSLKNTSVELRKKFYEEKKKVRDSASSTRERLPINRIEEKNSGMRKFVGGGFQVN